MEFEKSISSSHFHSTVAICLTCFTVISRIPSPFFGTLNFSAADVFSGSSGRNSAAGEIKFIIIAAVIAIAAAFIGFLSIFILPFLREPKCALLQHIHAYVSIVLKDINEIYITESYPARQVSAAAFRDTEVSAHFIGCFLTGRPVRFFYQTVGSGMPDFSASFSSSAKTSSGISTPSLSETACFSHSISPGV